jgi:presequence protease
LSIAISFKETTMSLKNNLIRPLEKEEEKKRSKNSKMLSNSLLKARSVLTKLAERKRSLITLSNESSGLYELEWQGAVAERNVEVASLRHRKTNARHVHVSSSDKNNVFFVAFKTAPSDSKGVAHILEHTALCGSARYQVRDPFFHMLNRSVNTYMNAWTGADFTGYPFSSQNRRDFDNLMGVYLDAAFFPRLDRLDFLQEGHRFEFERDGGDGGVGKLALKGVVYNEMKGAMSDPSSQYMMALQTALFETTTYHHNSGGDPAHIPTLSHDELVEFHRRHYHPSNALFVTYGDMPLGEHLARIDELALSRFDAQRVDTAVPDERRFAEPRRVRVSVAPTPGADAERPMRVARAWLLNNIADEYETFALSVVSSLLINGPNSPLYKALIDSGLGTDYAPASGYDSHSREATFSIGASGVRRDGVERVDAAIADALATAERDGFAAERVESLLHQVEIGVKMARGNFGLQVVSSLQAQLMHGASALRCLSINALIERLRADMDGDPRFLQQLVRRWLIDNVHRVDIVADVDERWNEREAAREAAFVADAEARLDDAARARIDADAKALLEHQSASRDPAKLACLPTLSVARDIERHAERVDLRELSVPSSAATTSVLFVEQPTNTLTHVRAIVPLPSRAAGLSTRDVGLLQLFCSVFAQMGTARTPYAELAQRIESHTAGIGAGVHYALSADGAGVELGVEFSMASLDRNAERAFDLLAELFEGVDFTNVRRLESLLRMHAASLEESIVESGNAFAVAYAKAALSPALALPELSSGMSQLELCHQLLSGTDEEVRERLALTGQELAHIGRLVSDASNMRCAVVAERYDHVEPLLARFVDALANGARPLSDTVQCATDLPIDALPPSARRAFISTPATVNFVGRALAGPHYADTRGPPLQLAARLASANYLHGEIREKGGAYGAGLSAGSSGALTFYTYRDPEPLRSLDVMAGTLAWLERDDAFSDEQIDEAKLALFGKIDSPVPPSAKGMAYFRSRRTHEQRQQRRERLLDASRQDIVDAARHFLSADNVDAIAVVGDESNERTFIDEHQFANASFLF